MREHAHPHAQESLVAGQRAVTEQVYDGSYPYYSYAHFNATVGEDRVSLDTFKYVASLVRPQKRRQPAAAGRRAVDGLANELPMGSRWAAAGRLRRAGLAA